MFRTTSITIITLMTFTQSCKLENKNPADTAGRSTISETSPESQNHEGTPFAGAVLFSKSGSAAHGTVNFYKTNGALKVVAVVDGVTPAGNHGIHIHEFGDCSAADASSAGGHFNPTENMHGRPNTNNDHVGDLGNITTDQNGHGELTLVLEDAHYDEEAFGGWEAITGKSVVLHEGPDDFTSQPSGNSGARIACGTIKESGTD